MSALSLKMAPLMPIAQKAQRALAILRQELVGVAQDFWKDGNWGKNAPDDGFVMPRRSADRGEGKPLPPLSQAEEYTAATISKTQEGLWHAAPGEISEIMWGKNFVCPIDEYITDLMIRPLGITKDMNLLDLAAGLGGRMRKTSEEYGVYFSGREPDPDIAARGMALSVAAGRGKRDIITAYDPMNLVEAHRYDCIVARETIYRVADKQKFIHSIISCCKPQAQICFTDYIVNPESQSKPAIRAWRAFESGASPVGLVEMAEMWAKAGISLRVHDDQTDYYKKEVKRGLVRFAKFMASGIKPDAATRKAIEKRITTWAHRMAALEQGMRFYRFYGLR
jgi:cyclopropane fatty-acyl-phospholipid synthase-like methyltransferase